MIFPNQPEKVYVVGAAGYWLDRWHGERRDKNAPVRARHFENSLTRTVRKERENILDLVAKCSQGQA